MTDAADEAWYDTPWGRRRCCPLEHEQSIGGDGYGGRCAGLADVMVVAESDPECPRHRCPEHCEARCCGACHAADVLEGEEACGGCLTDLALEQRANEELDERDRRATTIDDRTPADHELARQQQRRDDERN
jgi:hypothetical protein